MLLLDLSANCSDAGIALIAKIMRTIFTMIQIIGPIVALIAIAINVLKITASNDLKDEEKLKKKIFNSLIAMALLFLIPTFVNLLFGVLSQVDAVSKNFNIIGCWEDANKVSFSKTGKYIEKNKKDKEKSTSVIIKPDDYHGKTSGVGGLINSAGGNSMADAFVNLAVAQKQDPSRVGGQKYWQFMGWQSRVEWCACFVSWCIYNTNYGGTPMTQYISTKSSGVWQFITECQSNPRTQYHSRGYTPKRGDLIFFDWGPDGEADHIGIVQNTTNGTILTIEGNSSDAVNERTYSVNSSNLYGFCSWY